MWLTGPAAPRHVGSSQTRARTRVPCISRQILNHCATREALPQFFLKGRGVNNGQKTLDLHDVGHGYLNVRDNHCLRLETSQHQREPSGSSGSHRGQGQNLSFAEPVPPGPSEGVGAPSSLGTADLLGLPVLSQAFSSQPAVSEASWYSLRSPEYQEREGGAMNAS